MKNLERLQILCGIALPITATLFPAVFFFSEFRSPPTGYLVPIIVIVLFIPTIAYAVIGGIVIIGAVTKSKFVTGLLTLLLIPIVLITFFGGEWSTYGFGAVISKMTWLPVPIYFATVAISIWSHITSPPR